MKKRPVKNIIKAMNKIRLQFVILGNKMKMAARETQVLSLLIIKTKMEDSK